MTTRAVDLAARLRQAVQGCTVHLHGPVQAWNAVEEAAASGVSREEVATLAARSCLDRMRSLSAEGVPADDPRMKKEKLALSFIRTLYAGVIPERSDPVEALERELAPLIAAVKDHAMYGELQTREDLCRFMQHHVYAVWDFMCLLKALQRAVTCVDVVWRPVGSPRVRRLINEIVVGEESDTIVGGVHSHFEAYLMAMHEVGAPHAHVIEFVKKIVAGSMVSTALEECGAPEAARHFVMTTMGIVNRGKAHEIAAAFTYGREVPIPGMFTTILDKLVTPSPLYLTAYLERHIEVDGQEHGPAAKELLTSLCGDDEVLWEEAAAAAKAALYARVALWDAIAPAPVQRSAERRLTVVHESAGE
jgi:hypothetical protein